MLILSLTIQLQIPSQLQSKIFLNKKLIKLQTLNQKKNIYSLEAYGLILSNQWKLVICISLWEIIKSNRLYLGLLKTIRKKLSI